MFASHGTPAHVVLKDGVAQRALWSRGSHRGSPPGFMEL